MKLPKHILNALISNKTSLGDHPSYPPEEEEKFIVSLLHNHFNSIDGAQYKSLSVETLRNELNILLTKCKKIENQNREALEQLCESSINKLFQIPEDTIKITVKLVDNINSSDERLVPETTVDYSFDDISDMTTLTSEVYKRRMLNALISGAAMFYSEDISAYIKELFNINPELPALYKQIINLNNLLFYLEKDTIDMSETTNAGKVNVFISSKEEQVKIESEALFFPILLEETIKGLLELAISHGLPKNPDKAKYVMMKSDFKLAELWDMRLGLPLWERIVEVIQRCGYNEIEIGINFFFMILSMLPVEEFNLSLQEIFAKTRKGGDVIQEIMEKIITEKEEDEFNDYIQQKRDSAVQINDDDYYTSEKLLIDDEQIW